MPANSHNAVSGNWTASSGVHTTLRGVEKPRQCQKCGERIISDRLHVHRESCNVCGKPVIWCRCIGRTQRGDGECRAVTKEGEEVFLLSIVTIVPIERAVAARQMAAEFLQSRGISDAAPAAMLDVELRPIGGGAVSHVMCERFAYTDEVRDQVRWIRDSGFGWAGNRLHDLTDNATLLKSKMVTIRSDEGAGVLDYLGLEEVM